MVDNIQLIITSRYQNLNLLISISKTLPVSTATVERSFSTMNRILSWARNCLHYTRASDLMLLSMNRDIMSSVSLDTVLDRWIHFKKRIIRINQHGISMGTIYFIY